MARRATTAESRHMGRVKQIPCLVCGSWFVDVHHVVGYADRAGRAPKRHDRVVPLCKMHHDVQFGPHTAVHALGHQRFAEIYNIDLMAEAERLWSESEAA